MNDSDFKRLMAQQYLIYKKLIEIQDKLNGKSRIHADAILVKDFQKEVAKTRDAIDELGISL